MSRCIGCGVKLQTTDSTKPGYLPEVVMLERGEEVYCKRCHDIRSHNERYESTRNIEEYYQKIKVIKDQKALVLLIIDVMDIYGGFIPQLDECIGDNQVLILVNKVDLLPKSIKLRHIEEHVKKLANKQKLKVVDVMLISAVSSHNIDKVIAKIAKMKTKAKPKYAKYQKPITNFDDCYVVGCSSVGKSTFLNTVCNLYLKSTKNRLTTSDQFQTTLDFIKIPLDNKSFIIDTPGIVNTHSFGAYLDYESMRLITPKSYLKPKTYQLESDQTIFLGGLCQIDFIEGQTISASFYVANDLYLHRTKTINASDVMTKNLGKLLKPPVNEKELERLNDKKVLIFQTTSADLCYDLWISGLGFVHLNGESLKIKVTLPKEINVLWEESII